MDATQTNSPNGKNEDLFEQIAQTLSEYSEKTGLTFSTICVRALGSSRYPARLKSKQDKLAGDLQKLRTYIAENPSDQAEGDGKGNTKAKRAAA